MLPKITCKTKSYYGSRIFQAIPHQVTNLIITTTLHHFRKNLHNMPTRQRNNMSAVADFSRDLLWAHNWEADEFYMDLVSALAGIPRFIEDKLGR